LNRIDEIITFEQLSREDIREILHIQERLLQKKLEENNIRISFSEAFEDYMSDKGYDPTYGARPIKRLMQRELINLLATAILEGKIRKESVIKVDYNNGKISLHH
jgi:ATP-dependent Clp protease ATP-binding subunit ClpB